MVHRSVKLPLLVRHVCCVPVLSHQWCLLSMTCAAGAGASAYGLTVCEICFASRWEGGSGCCCFKGHLWESAGGFHQHSRSVRCPVECRCFEVAFQWDLAGNGCEGDVNRYAHVAHVCRLFPACSYQRAMWMVMAKKWSTGGFMQCDPTLSRNCSPYLLRKGGFRLSYSVAIGTRPFVAPTACNLYVLRRFSRWFVFRQRMYVIPLASYVSRTVVNVTSRVTAKTPIHGVADCTECLETMSQTPSFQEMPIHPLQWSH